MLTERPPPVGKFLVLTFADRGVSHGQCSGTPMAINLSFLDWSRFFYQVAPHLSSQESGPHSKPTATQKIWWRWELSLGPLG
jgi:hypothetical protein